MGGSATGLERSLRAESVGEVRFDAFTRGRYATDASSYQIMPVGVVVPDSIEQATRALAIARAQGVPVLARGGGTSQCGQTVNTALVIDGSKRLNRILSLDVDASACRVEPGIVLDELNRWLKPFGLWFPVDISTASRATIGGMAANNSCGGRSLRYGTMRDNVVAIDAVLANGEAAHFGAIQADLSDVAATDPRRALFEDVLAIGERESKEVAARFPAVQRRVGGYNLDALTPSGSQSDGSVNLAHLLVGSEGTLAYFTAIDLKLAPLLGRRAVGVCHFGSFYEAMNATQHIVALKPIAVELVDRTMIGLAAENPVFRPTLNAFLRGEPEALLLVEFAESELENRRRLANLAQLLGDLGFGWDRNRAKWGGVVEVLDPRLQTSIAEMRAAGLNIMMSMKDERKPVSFIEDCAVPLPHLADYTAKLTAVFEKHGTRGTWYAHASEGCLHVRPILNLKLEKDVRAMRAIAEEAFALVRAYKGSHSGEHGDGIVRSEFHEFMFGAPLTRAFEQIKDRFDPAGLFNPGKIVRAPRFDDRGNFRFPPDYQIANFQPALDWSAFPGGAGGFSGAVEMCNNNGECRKLSGGVMCPSYRLTRDERDVTRGRANSLRLALSGQLGVGALASDEMAETLKLCVSCKACRRECPTGVDMARMKIEALAARASQGKLTTRDRLIAYLPRYAGWASRLHGLMNLRDRVPAFAAVSEQWFGFSAKRKLPKWRPDRFAAARTPYGPATGPEVALFVDTFHATFERERIDAALRVLTAAGYRVHIPQGGGGERPLCCGRTFLSAGLVDEARVEVARSLDVLSSLAQRGVPIIGLEPSCLLTFRDEATALRLGARANAVAANTFLFEEFIARESEAGKLRLPLASVNAKALLHGHCHQKSFGVMGATEKTLRLVPGLEVQTADTSCCGMAGAFGYLAETSHLSLAMGELALLPLVRETNAETLIVADGFSCRHQILAGAHRKALHVAEVLDLALATTNAGHA